MDGGEGRKGERVGKGSGLRGRLGNKRCDVKRNCLTRQVAEINNKFARNGSAEILAKSSIVHQRKCSISFLIQIHVLARIIMIQ